MIEPTDRKQVRQEIDRQFGLALQEDYSPADLENALAEKVNRLIVADFSGLVQWLYRVDVDEQRIKNLLKAHPAGDAGLIIARLLIERTIQKIHSRKWTSRDDKKNDGEKW
jgi:hypothetical protein